MSKSLARGARKFYKAFLGSVGPCHPSPGRAILQGAPCAPAAPPRRSCNGAAQERLRPKGSLIEHLGVYSLSVLIFYEESLTQMRTKIILKNLPKHVSYVT